MLASLPSVPCIGENYGIDTISTRECIQLLHKSTMGRLGVTDRALPLILPVNFTVYHDWVVIRTAAGGVVAESARDSVVAFETDEVDAVTRVGWSVVVVGHANLIAGDHPLHRRLSALDLPVWGPEPRDRFIVIKMERVTGRRLAFGAESGAGPPT